MKIYAIKITDHAAQQLENIVRYIALDLNSPETAVRLYRRIRSRIESLSRLPQRHRTFFKMYRRIRVDRYSIVYTIVNDVVVIDSILYGSMDVKSHVY
ncbi:MAG: type II toxin-antitoxin system RelE/ParE family toxin [Pyramidobacter sp.]|nr:type II toxin-antitoxin system RelE/ParE family toxin [Pyramidobacter sp.]MBQ9422896.1 type II toxin-antitoxin system RelE/ParE family toxin [Pyramidobacter sp.]